MNKRILEFFQTTVFPKSLGYTVVAFGQDTLGIVHNKLGSFQMKIDLSTVNLEDPEEWEAWMEEYNQGYEGEDDDDGEE